MQQQKILIKQNGQFLWFQLLIELLSTKPTIDHESLEGIEELAKGLRQYFLGNEVQSKTIEAFEKDYGK